MELILFEIDGGYGFQIIQDGAVHFYQPTDVDGSNEPITEERALQFGSEVLQRLQ